MISEEQLAEAVALKAAHPSISAAALAGGIHRATLYNRLARAAEKGMLGTKPVLPGFGIKSVASKSEDGSWIKQTREHGESFKLPAGHKVKGVSALVDGEGREVAKWIKTGAEDAASPATILEAIKAAFADTPASPCVEPPWQTDGALMSVYPIADQHNGLLAWGRESGDSYDLKIGADRLRTCMARLVAQSPHARRALILNLGDWTHQDNSSNMTPRGGNVLDVDGRYCKVLSTGVRLMMDCIELALAKHEHVTVRNLPGNHDPHASFALTVALSCFYANNPRVTVDDSPSEWFFHRFGKTLIGAHHGHKAKPEQMAMTMACERREDWGATSYHWFLFGHIHHETAREVGDVRCESFQTLASRDAYHAGAGYVAGRSLTSITLHEEEGEVGRHRINIPPPGALPFGA